MVKGFTKKTKEVSVEDETEEVDVYFNPEIPEDFNRVCEAINILNKDMLNLATDLQVANPDSQIFSEFGGLCVEIYQQVEELYRMIPNTKKQIEKEAKFHSDLQEMDSLL